MWHWRIPSTLFPITADYAAACGSRHPDRTTSCQHLLAHACAQHLHAARGHADLHWRRDPCRCSPLAPWWARGLSPLGGRRHGSHCSPSSSRHDRAAPRPSRPAGRRLERSGLWAALKPYRMSLLCCSSRLGRSAVAAGAAADAAAFADQVRLCFRITPTHGYSPWPLFHSPRTCRRSFASCACALAGGRAMRSPPSSGR